MRKTFGNIISEENLEPKPNTEYIYNLDMIWEKGSCEGHFPIGKGIIVENVEQLDAGDYCFNIKGEGEDKNKKYTCTYGWAFIENTERNIKLLEEIEKECALLEKQEQKIEALRNHLDRLFKKTDCTESNALDMVERF